MIQCFANVAVDGLDITLEKRAINMLQQCRSILAKCWTRVCWQLVKPKLHSSFL